MANDGNASDRNGNARTYTILGGFPAELYAQQYPAEGSPDLAIQIQQLIPQVKIDQDWGLDHGSWTVLKFFIPCGEYSRAAIEF